MKKIYKLTDLCCANCAAEIERDVQKAKGICAASVNFITQKMTLEIEEGADVAEVLKRVAKIVRRVEPDCDMIEA
ncbi:MAG: heavy-metal-associated domain-containing protein [Clostridia bacterium]|nr:heavy-metal-associated domain-containing protein [Clostridia bacterium]